MGLVLLSIRDLHLWSNFMSGFSGKCGTGETPKMVLRVDYHF